MGSYKGKKKEEVMSGYPATNVASALGTQVPIS